MRKGHVWKVESSPEKIPLWLQLVKKKKESNLEKLRFFWLCDVAFFRTKFWRKYPQFERIILGWKIKNKFWFYLVGNEII